MTVDLDPAIDAGALAGVLVVDLSRVLAGPYATMHLADLGATVVKVERPGHGDDTRAWGPPFVGEGDDRESTYYLSVNRNKRSIELDFTDADDLDVLRELIAAADVLVENFRPGVMDRLGLGDTVLAELNSRLVRLSISGFGPDGPEVDRPGYDQIAQGEAGIMSLTGPDPEHPYKVGVPIGDLMAGMQGAFGVVAALVERERSGQGQRVDVSLLASLTSMLSFQATRWTLAGLEPAAEGNHHPTVAPYGAYRCADGLVQLAVGNDRLWRQFAVLVGIDPDDERFTSNELRMSNRPELTRLIEASYADRTRQEIVAELREAGIPAGLVKRVSEVFEDPQVQSQGLALRVDHETLGSLLVPGPSVRMSRTMRSHHVAPPRLGEDSQMIREWLANRSSQG